MVFEWVGHDLRTLPSDQFRENSNHPRIIAISVLSALAFRKTQYGAIHTGGCAPFPTYQLAKSVDINPNNIFLSGINRSSPTVKVGDLGNSEQLTVETTRSALIVIVLLEGHDKSRVQSLPTRGPEVWRDLGCRHSSDVWSLGVTVGRSPSLITLANRDSWHIGCHRQLFSEPKTRQSKGLLKHGALEFLVAETLESTTFEHPDTKLETQFIKVGTLRQELERLPGPKVSPELLDLLEYLLVVDDTKRPTALEALQHPYLEALP